MVKRSQSLVHVTFKKTALLDRIQAIAVKTFDHATDSDGGRAS